MINQHQIGRSFFLVSLVALWLGILIGTVGAFQFLFPQLFEWFPFFKSRSLHVSLVVSWVFLCAVGGIYHYLPKFCELPLYSNRLSLIHLWVFVITGVAILATYVFGIFGGREYWAFHPIFAIPITLSWVLFAVNFFKTVFKRKGPWPVYLWMWSTGILFFLYSYLEANAWVIPYFSNTVVKEITIQWKANGALVGSWNMLIYGTALFLMERISENKELGHSKMAFLLFFLGLVNLMFGWAHHTYIVPSEYWVRHIAYIISMTELLVLGRIIWKWKESLNIAKKNFHATHYKFLMASEVWIFLNLVLAILMSIPAINIYTHGTHITVAHAMGSMVGINTMILLASATYAGSVNNSMAPEKRRHLHLGFWITNLSLLPFWISLIFAGVIKGVHTIEGVLRFSEIMQLIRPYLLTFTICGVSLFIGLSLVVSALIPLFFKSIKSQDS